MSIRIFNDKQSRNGFFGLVQGEPEAQRALKCLFTSMSNHMAKKVVNWAAL